MREAAKRPTVDGQRGAGKEEVSMSGRGEEREVACDGTHCLPHGRPGSSG
jgi:hypothetical protein